MTFALIDGNSFYCSCERLFDRKLDKRAVIVLSNNDGCAVARTQEAKAVGIKMGAPYFQIKDLCARERVAVFSSNYELYGDISDRMNAVYRELAPAVEVYSIDETFLDLCGLGDQQAHGIAVDLRKRVMEWIGIPTCVGLAPTKTLAKLANKVAKDTPDLNGVCDLRDGTTRSRVLDRFAVAGVWGIGRALSDKLAVQGIRTAANLRDLDLRLARQLLTVVGERIVLELRGQSCLELETVAPQRKGLCVSRSFGARVKTLADMQQALCAYASLAAEKLRRHGLGTSHMTAFITTSRFGSGAFYSASRTFDFRPATNDTRKLLRAACELGRVMWREGFDYSKAGVICSDLVSAETITADLFDLPDSEADISLMRALDRINARFGRGVVMVGSSGLKNNWGRKEHRRSPRFTTRLDEIPLC